MRDLPYVFVLTMMMFDYIKIHQKFSEKKISIRISQNNGKNRDKLIKNNKKTSYRWWQPGHCLVGLKQRPDNNDDNDDDDDDNNDDNDDDDNDDVWLTK
jgi:hypothetical protein